MSIFSQLPNNLIMDIIRMADGGLYTHKKKLNIILQQIHNKIPIYYYKDGMGNDCPQYFGEDWGIDWGSDDEEEEDDY
tara:strand:+ start:63 stop:296 length:234 start_codon:yes stop_codon:yes gene_type:complete